MKAGNSADQLDGWLAAHLVLPMVVPKARHWVERMVMWKVVQMALHLAVSLAGSLVASKVCAWVELKEYLLVVLWDHQKADHWVDHMADW